MLYGRKRSSGTQKVTPSWGTKKMPYWSVYNDDTGVLISITATDPTSRITPPLASKERVTRPDLNTEMWDEVTEDWIARPARVWVDRIDDVVTDVRITDLIRHPDLVSVRGKLNAAEEASLDTVIADQIRAVLRELFGSVDRWRPSTHPVSMGGPPQDTPPT